MCLRFVNNGNHVGKLSHVLLKYIFNDFPFN